MDMLTVSSSYGGKSTHATIVVGNTYRVEPPNPQKKKNRGRTCEVTSIFERGPNRDVFVRVVWLDTGRKGWTDPCEFVEVESAVPHPSGA
jgi:hypothetical protein